jgi:carbonic anhydrase/acetyltransferase-like protein (isoleucine patch superfamily)
MSTLKFGKHTPVLSATAWLAPTATVIGNATVEDNAVVMFGAVIRADREHIVVGVGSNLQDNVVIHADPGFPAIIGAGVSVGHCAVIHGATLEDDVLIGMNASVLNGCIIGAGSLVAAGSVVLENTHIPPGSLVAGVPAKVRRDTTPEERAQIKNNAETYRTLARQYSRASQ